MNRIVFFVLLTGHFLLTALLITPDTKACQICVPYPEATFADKLLENEGIVFARELDDSPYTFYVVETLKGETVQDPIKAFCDSSTRRKLKVVAESVVVLTRAEKNSEWKFSTFARPDFQPFIRDLISIGESWSRGSYQQDRIDFFSELLMSDNKRVQQQAYLEIGRLPYSTIKQLAEKISREQIYSYLNNYRLVEWHNLFILILGQSPLSEDREYIRNKVEYAVRLGTTINLAAWLTAFMEAFPESGVEEVERMYFLSPARTKEEIEQVMASMSVLGGAAADSFDPQTFLLLTRIVNSYEMLLKNYPGMAGGVARDLASWRIQAYVKRLSELRKIPDLHDPSSTHLIDYYLSVAPRFRKPVRLQRK